MTWISSSPKYSRVHRTALASYLLVRETLDIGDRLLVIFDGHCGFCNHSVRWFLRRDRLDRLRFVPFESPKVAGLLARHGLDAAMAAPGPDTILVVRNPEGEAEQVFVRSEAALAMLGKLPRPWPVIAAGLRWVPRPLRDLGYRLVARWRYRIWGRLESCPIPTPQERERFL
jgi:predicted DCC family thiol-disulfide oxidoreductase YuxK